MKRIGDTDVLRKLSIRRNTFEGSMPSSFVGASDCPKCGGVGFVRLDVPVGHPRFGKLWPCDCLVEKRSERLINEYSQVSKLEHFSSKTFETFERDIPGVRDAFEQCQSYAMDPDGWLLLIGPYGCGKTHLAAAIANFALTQQRMSAIFLVVPDLLDQLRAAFVPDHDIGYFEQFNTIREIPLLVLDDLGTENATPWAREKLFQIINHRYNMRIPTVITTNRDIDTLDGRIASRLCDRQVCEWVDLVQVKDYRRRTGEPHRTSSPSRSARGFRRSGQ